MTQCSDERVRIPPYQRTHVPVGDGHELYVERWGTQGTIPVIFIHGGPGGGFRDQDRGFFDPELHDVLFWDQRGVGRSRFVERDRRNLTEAHVSDLEYLRDYFSLSSAALVGGSWGSTLALLYAQAYPERVSAIILRGLFLADDSALRFFLEAASVSRPAVFARFVSVVSEGDSVDLFSIAQKYLRGMTSGSPSSRAHFAQEWARYEFSISAYHYESKEVERALARPDISVLSELGARYFSNRFFLRENQIVRNVVSIQDIPISFIHGRHDLVSSAAATELFAVQFRQARVIITEAGHSGFDPDTFEAVVSEVRRFTRSVGEAR